LLEAPVGTIETFGTWTGGGQLLASGGSIWLNATGPLTGDVSTSDGGTIRVTGVIENTGDVLTIAHPGWQLDGGTIVGGSVVGQGGNGLAVVGHSTLDGVSLGLPLTISAAWTLTVLNGLQLDVPFVHSTPFATVDFPGDQTLSGPGDFRFDSTTPFTTLRASSGTLTVASDVLVHGSQGGLGEQDAGLLVLGSVVSDEPGALVLRGADWVNAGTLRTDGGDLAAGDSWTNEGLVWCGAHDEFTASDCTLDASGTLRVELAGNAPGDHARFTADGVVGLDGTLEVVLVEGYVPTVGTSFDVLVALGGVTGAFATYDLPAEVSWDVTVAAGVVTLTVVP
ncbi:MAG: hypothetical protein H6825_15185, partial [Planctomycetes bacterium]|nr:hypothetical protein [Planctomycetota bacterium]